MMNMKNIMAGLAAALLSASALYADVPVREYREILRLQENGMHGRSRHLFNEKAAASRGGDASGRAVLSEVIMNVPGYEARVKEFMEENPHSVLIPQITYRHALNLFDRQEYKAAGGYTWPKMKEHIIELLSTQAITIAEFAETSGSDDYKKAAQDMLSQG